MTGRDWWAVTAVFALLAATPQHVRGQDPVTPSPEGASGSIEWRTAIGVEAAATFNVRARAGRGEIMVRNHDGISFKGTILCYYRRSGHSVSFSGKIDSFEGANVAPNRQGTAAFRMSIEDSGSRNKDSDLVALVRSATPLSCTTERIADRPITHGDLTIR